MKRTTWHAFIMIEALCIVALAGCGEIFKPVAPASATVTVDRFSDTAPVESVVSGPAAANLQAGTKAVLLSVPGMT